MNAETLRVEAEQLQNEIKQMVAEHQKRRDALVVFTAQINSKLGELRGYQRLLAEESNAE